MAKKSIRKATQPRARPDDPRHVPGLPGVVRPNVKVARAQARRGDPYHVPGIGDIYPNVKVAHAHARRGDPYYVPGIGYIYPNDLPSGPLLLSKKGEKLRKQLVEDHNKNVHALRKQTS
jgi:hypothetical protein